MRRYPLHARVITEPLTDTVCPPRDPGAQAVTLLVRLAGAEAAAKSDNWISGFLDVPSWAEVAVNYASHQDWVSGITPIRFAPDGAVTANAYCAFLLRMLGYSDTNGDFTVANALTFAQGIGLVSGDYSSGALTRGDLFEITAGALTFHYKDSDETVIQRLITNGVSTRAAANALDLLDTQLTARQVADVTPLRFSAWTAMTASLPSTPRSLLQRQRVLISRRRRGRNQLSLHRGRHLRHRNALQWAGVPRGKGSLL